MDLNEATQPLSYFSFSFIFNEFRLVNVEEKYGGETLPSFTFTHFGPKYKMYLQTVYIGNWKVLVLSSYLKGC